MNEPTTPPESPGPLPGKLRKRRSTEKPCHHRALQLYLKDRSLKRVADAIGRSEKVTDHFWCGARDQGDVWLFDKPVANDLHPTMKPVELDRACDSQQQAQRRSGARSIRRLRLDGDRLREDRPASATGGDRPHLRRRHHLPVAEIHREPGCAVRRRPHLRRDRSIQRAA